MPQNSYFPYLVYIPHHPTATSTKNAVIWALLSQRNQMNTGAYEGMLIMFVSIMIPALTLW